MTKTTAHLSLITLILFTLISCKAETTNSNSLSTNSANTNALPTKEKSAMTATITELQKVDTQVGTGREAEPGFNVSVHYTGWLYDDAAADKKGQKFDSSVDRKQPFKFDLGAGQVIQGWDEGFAGMKIGGKRTLIIPAEMGYGARGAGGAIPPNATLIFDVELLDVK